MKKINVAIVLLLRGTGRRRPKSNNLAMTPVIGFEARRVRVSTFKSRMDLFRASLNQ